MAGEPKPFQLIQNESFTTGTEFLWTKNRGLSGTLVFRPYFATKPNRGWDLSRVYGRDKNIDQRQQLWRGFIQLCLFSSITI
ncbi:MAG: hypothetical protein F6K55_09045 [Moorea sp. SIO4A3]|nr:hypothetical protein [Moorena sp. SIO4A3]